MLYYVPLEPYKERYTEQLAAPKTGWLEREWRKNGIDYKRIDGPSNKRLVYDWDEEGNGPPSEYIVQNQIKNGVVLDCINRSVYAMDQVAKLLRLAEAGKLRGSDVIYFDDFWHPGIEALPYCFQQLPNLVYKQPRMYAFLYAQSVDEFDFTFPMRNWIRHFEKGIGSILSGIFSSCPTLTRLVVDGGIAPKEKVHTTGLIFSSEEVRSRMPSFPSPRLDQVVWSSRWDAEKRPNVFMEVARRLIPKGIKFVVCTGSKELRSNNPHLIMEAKCLAKTYPDNFIIKEGLSKEEYYAQLCVSKIQFNAALQDFVSFTLLEASVAGCYPVYPNYRSFPETLRYDSHFMYNPFSVESAVDKIIAVLSYSDFWDDSWIQRRSWIHQRFDTTWKRMTNIMLQRCGDLKPVFIEP